MGMDSRRAAADVCWEAEVGGEEMEEEMGVGMEVEMLLGGSAASHPPASSP